MERGRATLTEQSRPNLAHLDSLHKYLNKCNTPHACIRGLAKLSAMKVVPSNRAAQ